MCCAGAVITQLKTYAEDSTVNQNFNHMRVNSVALLRIRESVACILTHPHQSVSPCLTLLPNGIGKYTWLDLWSRDSWQILRIPRCTWKWLNYALSVFWLRNGYVATGFWCTTNAQLTNNSKPSAASYSTFYLCHILWDSPAGNV